MTTHMNIKKKNTVAIVAFNPSHIVIPSLFHTDENQQAPLKDPLHVPVGPITRARSKKIKEALNGLILTQEMGQRKMKT